MWSADIFLFVENFLSAATAFFNSIFYSIYLLIRKPKTAPRFLQKRLKDEKSRQVGPLTLRFLILFFTFIPFLLGGSELLNPKSDLLLDTPPDSPPTISKRVANLLSEEGHSSFGIYIVAGLASTAMVDAVSRIAASLGWPSRYRHRTRKNAETVSMQENLLLYMH